MSASDILIRDSDVFICEAFKQILVNPPAQLEQKLGSQARLAIATHLAQLPPEDQLGPAAMANHITEFCLRPGNEDLKEWLGEIYDRLAEDGIDKLVKQTLDPGDEADAGTEMETILLTNESRDIWQFLQNWATEELNQSNQANQTQVQGQTNQANQNASN
jgi:hypothetical protein